MVGYDVGPRMKEEEGVQPGPPILHTGSHAVDRNLDGTVKAGTLAGLVELLTTHGNVCRELIQHESCG